MKNMLCIAAALSFAPITSIHLMAQEAPATSASPDAALLVGVEGLPNIKPGECYVRVQQPAKFETIEERVLVKPETIRYEIVPAEFKDVEREIVVKPETTSYEIVPAQFESKEVDVVAAPDFTNITATEPQFQSEDATVVTKIARIALRLEQSIFGSSAQTNGEVLSLVNEDAEAKTYARHLLIKPAQLQQEKVAKLIEKVVTQVLVKPAEVKEVKIPAEVKKIMVKELVRPATKKEIKIPAEYATITRKRLIQPEKIAWQRVLCASDTTPDMVKSIQLKLKEKGIDCGEASGELNDATKKAVVDYQSKNNLAQGGLTYEFLEHIGLSPAK